MRILSAALACAAVVAVGLVLVSGGSGGDPHTPPALPGLPPPFLGTAVSGDGGLTAAVDAYGDVVDLRAPGPAGEALIDNPSDRQAAGSVPTDTGIVPRLRVGGGPALPMWRADSVAQRYLPGTNVVRTVARFGGARLVVIVAAEGEQLAVMIRAKAAVGGGAAVVPDLGVNVESGIRCARERRARQLDLLCQVGRALSPVPGAAAASVGQASARVIRSAGGESRRWLARSRPLGSRTATARREGRDLHRPDSRPAGAAGHRQKLASDAPGWAQAMYRRSLLTIHALTSKKTGAVSAGARDGWAYVWPRDASTAALALAASGHRAEARHVARFLTHLDLSAAARFDETGAPIPGRAAQGDAAGWVDTAAAATALPVPSKPFPWRNRADYQESSPGTYLGNALAAAGAAGAQFVPKSSADDVDGPKTGHIGGFSARQHGVAAEVGRVAREFGTADGLVRTAGNPTSGLDSAAGWAVRPFGLSALYPAAGRTLLRLASQATPYGITPGEGWTGGEDPWMAPTAWSAWALAGLATEGHASADRRAALRLLADLRRAATPAGALPERVGAQTGIPTSTTPLLWSSAFTVLALRELWP
jgi:glucoamylase